MAGEPPIDGESWLLTLTGGEGGGAESPAPSSALDSAGPALPLLRLAGDTLVGVLELLSARDLAGVAAASRLLLLLARELQRRPSLAAEVGAPGQVFAALGQRLVATPTIGFLFCTGQLRRSGVAEVLPKRLPPHCHVIGAETQELQALVPAGRGCEGVAAELRSVQQRGQLSVMLGSFPHATAQSFHVSAAACEAVSQGLEAAAEGNALERLMLQHHLPVGPDWGTIVLIVGRLDDHFDPECFVKGVQRCCPNAAIIGGVAGMGVLRHAHGRTSIWEKAGIVGLALKGNVPLTALVSRGCMPWSPPLRARGHEVRRYENEDGVEEHCLTIPALVGAGGDEQTSLSVVVDAQQNAMAHEFRPFPFYIGYRFGTQGGYTLEQIGQDNFGEGGELHLAWASGQASPDPLPECMIRFYQLGPEESEKDLRQMLGYVKHHEEQTLGAIMFTCGGRGAHFFRDKPLDMQTFHEVFPSQPLVGFWAGGEIGPQALAEALPEEATRAGSAALQGFTAVFGIFRVPPPPRRRTWPASLAEDQAAPAVAELFARLAREASGRAECAAGEGDAAGAAWHRARAAALAAIPTAALPAEERAGLLAATA